MAEQRIWYEKVQILITESMNVVSCEVSLANTKNKSRLIEALKDRCTSWGIAVEQSEGDAYLLIVQTALHVAKKNSQQVCIVGGRCTTTQKSRREIMLRGRPIEFKTYCFVNCSGMK